MRSTLLRTLGVLLAAGGITFAAVPGVGTADTSWPTAETFANAGTDANNWVLPAHDYSGNRYLASSQITKENVGTLKSAWKFKIPDDSPIETAPIVWNGTVYVTSAHNNVYALDAKTGARSGPSATTRT